MQNFEEIRVLGTRFHKVTCCQLIQFIVQSAKLSQKTIIGHVNVRAMNFAYELPWYRAFLNQADLVFCDGFGVLLGANLLGYSTSSKHRMTCPDYIENLAKTCAQQNVSLFLLAGRPGVVDIAIGKMKSIAPDLRVQGHHGHFKKVGQENEAVVRMINEFQPDVLYIGFGMPLQEQWILENVDKVDARVFLPLGACLDFYTGTVYRGPKWMTERGFEWLTRLCSEPTRLWDRYIVGNPLFFYRVLKQKFFSKSF